MTSISESNGVVTFRLAKSYDALHGGELQQFENAVAQCIKDAEQPLLVFDFSETMYINSSFVEAVMRAWKRLQAKDGRMALCCLNNNCATVLKVCRLDHIWDLCETHDQAMQCVAQGSP